jgi:hypothetical protein
MKSTTIQARLQSRIAKRSNQISDLEGKRSRAKFLCVKESVKFYNECLKNLRAEQKLDKDIIRNVYWGMFLC